MPTLQRGTLFDPVLIPGLVDNIKGKSALAQLCGSTPIAFNGQKEFIFTMGSEANLVAEAGAKPAGSIGISSRTIVPVKIEYGSRVTDEFMYGSEDLKLDILKHFSDGFAKKAARALDIMAIHGMNPRTATVSSLLGTNYFDNAVTSVYQGTGSDIVDADSLVESAVAAIGEEYDASGMAMTKSFRTALAQIRVMDGNNRLFPELSWGQQPGSINGMPVTVNSTVSFGSSTDLALIGDFETAFKWGYSKEIPLRVIEYGCPDNDTEAGDLQGHNEVYIRCELYLGWGVLDPTAFCLIKSGDQPTG